MPRPYTLTAGSHAFILSSAESRANYSPTSVDDVRAGERNVVIRMKPGCSISGTVTGSSGYPVSDAEVVILHVPSSATPDTRSSDPPALVGTDGDGHYSARGLAPGKYAVTVRRHGYASSTIEVHVSSDVTGQDLVLKRAPHRKR